MLALTVLTALNTFNGGFLVASRFIYAAAREKRCRAVRQAEPQRRAVAGRLRPGGCRPSWRRWSSPPANGCCWSPWGRHRGGHLRARVGLSPGAAPERVPRAPVPAHRGRPLASFGAVLFTVMFLATGLSDPKHPSHLSVVPLAVILCSAPCPSATCSCTCRSSRRRPRCGRRPTGRNGGRQADGERPATVRR